jgi:hypothetical protein
LGQNVVLSRYEGAVLRDFLRDPSPYRRTDDLPALSPSDIIVADLERRGFV